MKNIKLEEKESKGEFRWVTVPMCFVKELVRYDLEKADELLHEYLLHRLYPYYQLKSLNLRSKGTLIDLYAQMRSSL